MQFQSRYHYVTTWSYTLATSGLWIKHFLLNDFSNLSLLITCCIKSRLTIGFTLATIAAGVDPSVGTRKGIQGDMAKNGRKTQANKSAPEAGEGGEGEEEEEPEGAAAAGEGDGQEGDDEPDDFEKAIAGAQSAAAATDAPWWSRSDGARFWGRLQGMYYMGGNTRGPKEYLQVVSLIDQTICIKGKKGKDRKQVIVKKGQILSIGYNKALDIFFTKYAPMVEAGAVVNIGARVTGEKRATQSGNDFWPMEPFVKVVRPTGNPWSPYRIGSVKPSPNQVAGEGDVDGGSDADVPF